MKEKNKIEKSVTPIHLPSISEKSTFFKKMSPSEFSIEQHNIPRTLTL